MDDGVMGKGIALSECCRTASNVGGEPLLLPFTRGTGVA